MTFTYPTANSRKVLHEGKVYEYLYPISLSDFYHLEGHGTTIEEYFNTLKIKVQTQFDQWRQLGNNYSNHDFIFVPRSKYVCDNYGYDSESANEIELHIVSVRDETPEEIEKREATAQRKSEAAKKVAEDAKRKKKVQELALLEKLKKKYGNRYTIYNPLLNFYDEGGKSFKDFQKKFVSIDLECRRHANELGYTENIGADVTGGDHDYIILDNENEQFCWWENGFQPFSGDESCFPTTHNLEYWADHRS